MCLPAPLRAVHLGASCSKFKSQPSWTCPSALPGSVHASQLLATSWLAARTRAGNEISRIGDPASQGTEVGMRTVGPTTFRAASTPGDCKHRAEPKASPNAEFGTKGQTGIREFAIDRMPLRPLPGSVEFAKFRQRSRLPVAAEQSCGQQQTRGSCAERQCDAQS